jgi:alpha-L-fucosidase 2
MDLLLIREVFRHLLSAAGILKKEEPLLAEIRAALPKIRPITTGADGRLLEYSEDFGEDDVHHRHLSHLYGVYPGDEFTRTQHPELFRASRLSLERRGDQSTGWAMGWRVVLWARFRDGERACRVLRNLLTFVEPIDIPAYRNKGGVYANLFDAHPPFQIDGNFGAAAGIAEMLVQSHEKDDSGRVVVDLLPALPPAWSRGRVSGLRCRGGLTLAFAWEADRLSHLRIQASFPAEIVLACGSMRKVVKLSPGETVVETESC